MLSIKEKEELKSIAKLAVEKHVRGEEYTVSSERSVALNEERGAFVTLKVRGRLRGCIGVFDPEKPLFEVVREMAVAACSTDSRFNPVTEDELKEIEVEISALTPMKRVTDLEDIEVGRHGLYVVKGLLRGVLLPQVATEHGFDRDTFLDETCIKAGLYEGAWREGETEVYTFEAEVF